MEALSNLGLILGGSWASGVNLYLTIAGLGIINRLGIIDLPGNLDVISHPLVIISAVLLYIIEFVADKVPVVDSAWDTIHTFIRPIGGAVLAYMGTAEIGPAGQIPIALLCGAVAADSHLTKATARVAINTSPEPFSNSAASLAEDGLVLTVLWLIVRHPVIASIAVICFILFSIWFLRTMFRFVKKIFSRKKQEEDSDKQDKM